jgi:hypothetical protein
MFPSFPRYKEGTGGRGQIEPGPPVVILHLKNVACNYCIIPEKNVACNSDEKNGECKFEEKKTTSVILKKKNDECNGKKKTASVYSHGPSRPS